MRKIRINKTFIDPETCEKESTEIETRENENMFSVNGMPQLNPSRHVPLRNTPRKPMIDE